MSPSAPSSNEKRAFASEIKFLLDPAKAESVQAWAREHLAPDPNAGGADGDTYRVTSLYFDTPDLALFHRRGWLQHSKFRIRRYGAGAIFFERKLKASGRVAKHRTPFTAGPAAALDQHPAQARWFAEKIAARRLQPICQIDYRRVARVAMTAEGPIRLTLDEGLRALPVEATRFDDSALGVRLTEQIVLELKFRRELPVLFRDLAARFNLNPQPFSKYRTAVELLGLATPQPLRRESAEAAGVCTNA